MVEKNLVLVHGLLLDLLANAALDLEKLLDIILGDKSDCLAGLPGPGSPADPVDVVLGTLRNVIVDHDVNVGDVQASGCDLSGDEDVLLLGLELL